MGRRAAGAAVTTTWPEVLAAALVGTARSGGQAEALLDAAAAQALRRRAGVALVPGASVPAAAPPDGVPMVGPDAAARVDTLLALDSAARDATPVRDMEGRLELLAEWLAAAAAAHRRLPPELLPALLETARRHRALRPLVGPVAGPLAGWLATQRADWSYAASTPPTESTVDDVDAWELGAIAGRVAYLGRLRRHDPARARELLETAWDDEAPDDRAALLGALETGLSGADEPLLERALDDRRRQVRTVALDLLARLPGSAYGRRMAARAAECVDLAGSGPIAIVPPAACDRSMRRDGIVARPPAGTGERAWWLEEILAYTPLSGWPPPAEFLGREVSEAWSATVRRGLARAAAAQRHGAWAVALVDPLTADVAAHGHPDDRLLLRALYDVLPVDELTARAGATLDRGLADAMAVGVEHVLALCPKPWPPAVADAVFRALAEQLSQRGAGWRAAGLCELAALRLAPDVAPRGVALVERLRAIRPNDPGVAFVERFAATLRYRLDMLEELA
ncbi:MAG: hypothetical protein AUI10_06210 [Actinobacteria bacterium 13_2_20CM_2_72_6]|nr:MAG: hypothetical protein AUI10_06210 [Actinobacteria bacterium 13_2_20CM_2_72_6]